MRGLLRCPCAICQRQMRSEIYFDVVIVVLVGAALAFAEWRGWL